MSDGLTLMCGVQEGGGVRYGGDWLVLDKVGERLELNIGDCCDSLMLGRGRLVVVGKKLQLVMGGGGVQEFDMLDDSRAKIGEEEVV